MKYISIGKNGLVVPQIGMGCMRIAKLDKNYAKKHIQNALDNGVNFFEHADIYGGGECESFFAEVTEMNPTIREKMIIQTKCGIRKNFLDFSKEHILNSVDTSLKRLKTDYIDNLLLHRPDALIEPEEVAETFSMLKKSGKVRHFGVSNHNAYQIELMKKYCDVDIEINQLQFSITECGMIDSGLNVNMKNDLGINRDDSILDYCRLNGITIQAWSPFQYGFFKGVFIDSPLFPELNDVLTELAEKYSVTKTSIATAWINRHPAKIQTIAGTTNIDRFTEICKSTEFELTREEWYKIYLSTGKKLP